MPSLNDSVPKIKQSIIKILFKINSHFDYPMDDKKIELISEDWIDALFKYSDDVISHAYKQIIQQCKKRPTLAEFVTQCNASVKVITANNQGFTVSQQNMQDYEKWENYRAAVARKYGEVYAQRHLDSAKAEYDIAKADSKFEEYKSTKLKQVAEFLRNKKFAI
jgi:hypothetical protein